MDSSRISIDGLVIRVHIEESISRKIKIIYYIITNLIYYNELC